MSESNIVIIPITELIPGMYVTQVVKQKGQLKMKSKGLVKTEAVINSLVEKGILEVEIDYSKSHLEEMNLNEESTAESSEEEVAESKPKKKLSTGESLNASQVLHDKAKKVQEEFLSNIRDGQKVDVEPVKEIADDIIDSVFDDADGLCCVAMIKDAPDYILEHAINCSIYMALFAKHLGFDKEMASELCLAGLLMDSGMATVPEDILNKPKKLDRSEMDIVKTHVDFGIEILEQSDQVNDAILDIIRDHHERLDGSGYPEGKSGDTINTYGRMAAIVDSYDAMLCERPYRKGMTPTNALKQLLADGSGKYDPSLVQQFIRCIGVHPVGSLVKLKSGKLGIIIISNKEDPLKPVIMTFYSIKSNHHTEVKRLDLSKVDDEIETSVKPEEFKMNLNKFFREVFLASLS